MSKGSQMKTRLMTSALAITAALAYGSIAVAQDAGPTQTIGGSSLIGSANGNDNSVDDSNNTDVEVDVEDSGNDNSDNSTEVEDSFNDNSDNSTEIEDSGNDNSDNSTEIEDSGNDNSDHSTDDSFNDNSDNSTEYEDSFNDESDNSVENEDSFNDNSDHSVETEDSFNDNSDNSVEVEDSYNYSVDDSYNDNSDHSQTHLALSLQVLAASVSDIQFNMWEQNRGDQNGDINTGAINQQSGAFAGFAGIQTVTNNTGLASIGQAATAISANANVTFGGPQ